MPPAYIGYAARPMSPSQSTNPDTGPKSVVIVGGGLAGLSAAETLSRAGVKTTLLEARDRVGGRTYTTPFGRTSVDHGAQWIGANHHRMLELCSRFNLEVFETHTAGRKILESKGRITSYSGDIPSLPPLQLLELQLTIWRLDRLARTVPRAHPLRATRARQLDRLNLDTWVTKHVRSRRVRGLLRAAVRVVWGAELHELSLLHFLWYVNSSYGLSNLVEVRGANQHWRIVEGAQAVALRLAETISPAVRLAHPVTRVERREAEYRVHTPRGGFEAEHVILALPPPLTTRIQFDPPLPALHHQYAQRTPLGSTIKAHLTYRSRFWQKLGYSGEAVSDGAPISVVYDNTDAREQQPALVAFVVADAARALAERSREERRQAVIEGLIRIFGEQANACTDYTDYVWAADPYSGGAPVAFHPPGALSSCGQALREPIAGLRWASTETATEWTGFMEGAVESGRRVAMEVLNRNEP